MSTYRSNGSSGRIIAKGPARAATATATAGTSRAVGQAGGDNSSRCCCCCCGSTNRLLCIGVWFLVLQQIRIIPEPHAITTTASNGTIVCKDGSKNQSIGNDHVAANDDSRTTRTTKRTLGRKIVEEAYEKTYKVLEQCPESQPLDQCLATLQSQDSPLRRIHAASTSNSNDTTTTAATTMTYPWWFETLLRDGSTPGQRVHGWWHKVQLPTPWSPMAQKAHAVDLCVMEKIASTEWRRVTCELHGFPYRGHPCHWSPGSKVPKQSSSTVSGGQVEIRAHKAVFLRDPLERFLSAFRDKCITGNRKIQKHCEPNAVFLSDVVVVGSGGTGGGGTKKASSGKKKRKNDDDDDEGDENDDKSGDEEEDDDRPGDGGAHRDLVTEFLPGKKVEQEQQQLSSYHGDRLFFEAYVDTMPLSWNVHFFPQSLYCDGLYRKHLDQKKERGGGEYDYYDFVGVMDENYQDDLRRMGETYNITDALEAVFKLQLRTTASNTTTGGDNSKRPGGRARAAFKDVNKYYTAKTVRRVLEYLSIDYVKLGLPIPQWAEDILALEQQRQQQQKEREQY